MHTVIQDIVGQMFDSRCVQELFRPTKVFTKKSLRGVFAQLAHASIMKLNSTAMEKVSTPKGVKPANRATPQAKNLCTTVGSRSTFCFLCSFMISW